MELIKYAKRMILKNKEYHMIRILKVFTVFYTTTFLSACEGNLSPPTYTLNEGFGDYWYQGKAELASYELEQVRYGETRHGSAVLIFVTEDFSKSKQVKLDYPIQNKDDILKVLKLNATRKFTTGIYPYSTMSSVFTPLYQNISPQTVKLTTSSQEWCGHTFLQANLRGNNYQIQSNSYFESEGDLKYDVSAFPMEDGIWNQIRLNPEGLPIGTFSMLPGSLYCRFKHVEFKESKAEARLEKDNEGHMIYQIEYPDLSRLLKIRFNAIFPHEILGWEESYPEGGKSMTTKANLKSVKQLDYWNRNKNEDAHYRIELGLD